MPSSVRIPFQQCILLGTVNRKHVQILSFDHFFLNAIEKTAINLDSSLLGFKNSIKDQPILKELEVLLSNLQMKFSYLESIEKALESVQAIPLPQPVIRN